MNIPANDISAFKESMSRSMRSLQISVEALNAWLITNPMDYVVVSRDRMRVVQRIGDIAQVAHYPQLPSLFYSGNTARDVAANIKAFNVYDGANVLIKFESIMVSRYAPLAIADLNNMITAISDALKANA